MSHTALNTDLSQAAPQATPQTTVNCKPAHATRKGPSKIFIKGRELYTFCPNEMWMDRYMNIPILKKRNGKAAMEQYAKNGREIVVLVRERGSLKAADLLYCNVLPKIKKGDDWYFCMEDVNPKIPDKDMLRPIEDQALVQTAAKQNIGIIDPLISPISKMAADRCMKDNPELSKRDIAEAALIMIYSQFSPLDADIPVNMIIPKLAEDLGYSDNRLYVISDNFLALDKADRFAAAKKKKECREIFEKLTEASNILTVEGLNTALDTSKDKNVLFIISPEFHLILQRMIESDGFKKVEQHPLNNTTR